jgi:hypothetical protein
VVGSYDKISCAALNKALFLSKQPLSVKYVRGTWEVHPSINFLRMLSGTRYAALVPTKPGILAGLLRSEIIGSMGGVGVICVTAGALITGGAKLSGGGSKKGKDMRNGR